MHRGSIPLVASIGGIPGIIPGDARPVRSVALAGDLEWRLLGRASSCRRRARPLDSVGGPVGPRSPSASCRGVTAPSPWSAPESIAAGHAGAPAADVQFSAGSPLGGVAPRWRSRRRTSDRRELVLTGSAPGRSDLARAPRADAVAGLRAPVRRHRRPRPAGSTPTAAWAAAGSSIVLAVLLAVAGVLIASASGAARAGSSRRSPEQRWSLVSIVEWGLGAGSARSGPGTGLWAMLVHRCAGDRGCRGARSAGAGLGGADRPGASAHESLPGLLDSSLLGRIAQLARALPRHGRGPRFKSVYAHQSGPLLRQGILRFGFEREAPRWGSIPHPSHAPVGPWSSDGGGVERAPTSRSPRRRGIFDVS